MLSHEAQEKGKERSRTSGRIRFVSLWRVLYGRRRRGELASSMWVIRVWRWGLKKKKKSRYQEIEAETREETDNLPLTVGCSPEDVGVVVEYLDTGRWGSLVFHLISYQVPRHRFQGKTLHLNFSTPLNKSKSVTWPSDLDRGDSRELLFLILSFVFSVVSCDLFRVSDPWICQGRSWGNNEWMHRASPQLHTDAHLVPPSDVH